MSKRKVCRRCKLFVEEDQCPNCKGTSFTNNWQGRLFVSDPNKSFIAQQIGIKVAGEYAIKVK